MLSTDDFAVYRRARLRLSLTEHSDDVGELGLNLSDVLLNCLCQFIKASIQVPVQCVAHWILDQPLILRKAFVCFLI